MSKEMRTDRLNIALLSRGKRADDLEVLLGSPALRESRQDERSSSHAYRV